ncbi:hypothetical protein ACLVWU_08410 [Bdellovibrio sp. HCB290]|uniref:hypothetical protein n=1 Tax=Bdellovibrio sp. HCB290 TaxID=3394356 RepID=UPI0039B404C6
MKNQDSKRAAKEQETTKSTSNRGTGNKGKEATKSNRMSSAQSEKRSASRK